VLRAIKHEYDEMVAHLLQQAPSATRIAQRNNVQRYNGMQHTTYIAQRNNVQRYNGTQSVTPTHRKCNVHE
jgi:hypothetical protein